MGRRLPEPITKEEFDKLLAVAKKERESYRMPRKKILRTRGKRINQYMIAMVLAFQSGLRISEIVGYQNKVPALTRDRIEGKWIRVKQGKGSKDRMTPKAKLLTKEAIQELPLTVSRRAIQLYVSHLGKKVLNKHIWFHQFRHGFVTHCLENNMAMHYVQAWAGHSRLDTTGLYTHILKPEEHVKQYEEVF